MVLKVVNPSILLGGGGEGQLPPTSLRVKPIFKPKIDQAEHFRPKSCCLLVYLHGTRFLRSCLSDHVRLHSSDWVCPKMLVTGGSLDLVFWIGFTRLGL